ncbi:hypothetical protein SN10_19060 [Vibrio harveyi]|nr:hypothetical protein SN10_19060 [Vibrio harveyi]
MHLTPSDPDISTLVKKIEKNRLDLQPNFQRGEVWGLQKKQRLIDSILRGWHIPPIHVIAVPNSSKQEVLDGQQRLAAIRDFVANKFTFNASFEPYNPAFKTLDGLYYSQLDDDTQGKFDDFTIRIITISDYDAGEPGELFYRLNQPTNLTSAEQRNAYFGEARQQVKDLSDLMDSLGYSNRTIGFNNSRMAYDDILAKLLLSIEFGTLDKKITANLVTQRYRDTKGFSRESIKLVREALHLMIEAIESYIGKAKLNKSTLYSWLFFFCVSISSKKLNNNEIILFFSYFESIKDSNDKIVIPTKMTSSLIINLLSIFNDRSSSRVADISSVKLRDIILWAVYATTPDSFNNSSNSVGKLRDSLYYLSSGTLESCEKDLLEFIKYTGWGAYYDFF